MSVSQSVSHWSWSLDFVDDVGVHVLDNLFFAGAVAEQDIGNALDFGSLLLNDSPQMLVVFHELLERRRPVRQVHTQLFALLGELLHRLRDLDTVQRGLSQLLIVLDQIVALLLQRVILVLHLLQ